MLPSISNSMDADQEIIPYCNRKQVALDFADQLPSGFRFNPTDSELIVDCLNAKIESRELPKCRLHEVNIYNHKPEELAARYRSHGNKWYFLTPRDRKYRRGNRPDRAVLRKVGFWKTTQKQKPVYDATRQMIGHKGTLAFIENGDKTKWLMHEYTTNEPNLPFEKGDKLNEWVLCKIYKKEKTVNSRQGTEEVGSIMNPKEVTEEPLPNRRRSRVSEINFSNHEQVDVQEANRHLDTQVQMEAPVKIQQSSNEFNDYLTNPMEFAHTWVNEGVVYKNGQIGMNSSPYPIPMQQVTTFQGRGLIQALSCYQNQFTSNASNGCQISDCATSSVSIEPPASSSAQLLDDGAYTTPTAEHGLNSIQPVQRECYQNMFSSIACDSDFLFSDRALNSSSMGPLDYGGYTPVLSQISNEDGPTLLDVQTVWDQSTQDGADDDFHFPHSDGYEAITISDPVEVEWSLGSGDEADDDFHFSFPDGYETTVNELGDCGN